VLFKQTNNRTTKEHIMSALLKSEVFVTTNYENTPATKNPSWTPRVITGTPAPVKAETRANPIKNIALFLAAPFIGLAYLLAMPVVGLGMLAWIAGKAIAAKYPVTKAIAATLAAPFIGLAFILAMPVVGFGALAWVGTHRATNR
jgi:hypothetical protein